MSEENVELLREVIREWNREYPDGALDLPRDFWDPEVEFLPLRSKTEGAYRGISGIEAFIADTIETFEKFEFNLEFQDLGGQVLAWGTLHVRARTGGVETDVPIGGLYEFRDGRVSRWEDFGSREAALEAAGLPE